MIEIPTENPLSEDESWHYIRDVVLGLEYRTLTAPNTHTDFHTYGTSYWSLFTVVLLSY